ncbi:unnamed protein product [Lymnaea stagnalis]|uniref:FAM20 C-terminal domain-containing protein n=1 Tax=Lymnaea stagnalis TaxID=6523 RepID=A0AAV2HDK4_LYMST
MWLIRRVKTVHILYLLCVIAMLLFISFFQLPEVTPLPGHGQRQRDVSGTQNVTAGLRRQGSRDYYRSPVAESLLQQYQSQYKDLTTTVENTPFVGFYYLNETEPYKVFLKRLKRLQKTGIWLKELFNISGTSSWERFHRGINQYYLYDPDNDTTVQDLMTDLSTRNIVLSEEDFGGSQLKLKLTFDDAGQGLFKPRRQGKGIERLQDKVFYLELESHTAEIAAFHLDRLLGFYRVPPAVGRAINVTMDVSIRGDESLRNGVFTSPEGRVCFYGHCLHCDRSNAACGMPELLEGSVVAYLPMNLRIREKHPYQRTFVSKKNQWEKNTDYCETDVKKKNLYLKGRTLLDLMDMAVFDFLIGNIDRHHFERFKDFGLDSFILHHDTGKGFGKPEHDCASCMTPLRQCCVLRLSTLAKLLKLYQGPQSLSELLRSSLLADPLSPILGERHLHAADRRIGKVIRAVGDCLKGGKPWETVVIDN